MQTSKDWVNLAECNHLQTCQHCKAELKRAIRKAKEEQKIMSSTWESKRYHNSELMQQSFRCVLCGNSAEGYIEDSGFGWRDPDNNKIYLCKLDYITIYKNLKYKWHPLE